MTRAGLPPTIACGGTSRVTTAHAATIETLPTTRPGRIVARSPIHAPSSIRGGERSVETCSPIGRSRSS
jgi:hypothetical protein